MFYMLIIILNISLLLQGSKGVYIIARDIRLRMTHPQVNQGEQNIG